MDLLTMREPVSAWTHGAGLVFDKTFTIIVNARRKTVTSDELRFEQVVALAHGADDSRSFAAETNDRCSRQQFDPEGGAVGE